MLNKIAFLSILAGFFINLTGCKSVEPYNIEKKSKTDKITIAVVTGGHDFQKKPFLQIFSSYKDVNCTHIHLQDESEIFENIDNWPYDVIVLYNMTQRISPKRRANFIRLLHKGVGVLALHHSIAAFNNWPEYRKIIGAKYYLKDTIENGVLHKRCQYKHGVNIKLHVADDSHPITRGISDFTILDETYKGSDFEPDNHILVTTDEPSSDRYICWVRNYSKARVCYIQSGHGDSAYTNKNFRKLVHRAIRFCAGRL